MSIFWTTSSQPPWTDSFSFFPTPTVVAHARVTYANHCCHFPLQFCAFDIKQRVLLWLSLVFSPEKDNNRPHFSLLLSFLLGVLIDSIWWKKRFLKRRIRQWVRTLGGPQWFANCNRNVFTGPIACPLARSLEPLTRSIPLHVSPNRALRCTALTYSLTPELNS